jgi:D-lyxose ketol-isomerase
LEVEGSIRRMVQGDNHHLLPGIPHRFWAVNDVCTIVECSTQHLDDDVVRLENSKERK